MTQVRRVEIQSAQSLLLRLFSHGEYIGCGTGFVVTSSKGPRLITNYHVLAGKKPHDDAIIDDKGRVPTHVRIMHNKDGREGEWVEREEGLHHPIGTPLWREHPSFGREVDCVALPLSQLDDVALYPYAIDKQPDICIGPSDVASVLGFPFGQTAGGYFAIWATGFLASEMDVDWNDKPCFLIDCRTRPGQSGSPVIAFRTGATHMTSGALMLIDGSAARLLGVYSGRIHGDSDIGVVWKLSALREVAEA